MGVFLRLRDPGLLLPVGCQELAEGIGDALLVEGHQLIGDRLVIVCKADIDQIHPRSPVKAGEVVVAEGAGDLAGTVRTEVVEDDRIMLPDQAYRLAVLHHYGGHHELVVFLLVIGSLDPGRAAERCLPDPLGQRIIGQLGALPVLIPVHGIITAHD